jgi:MFS family permease
LHVHHDLGLSTFVVGLVTGSQFLAALVSRVKAGMYADRRGARRAVVVGLLAAMSGGVLYVASLPFAGTPVLSAAALLLGRALIGGAESFIITGGVTLGLALAGPQNAGKVIAWVGMAMFAALASGAPLGTMSLRPLGLCRHRSRHGTYSFRYTGSGRAASFGSASQRHAPESSGHDVSWVKA